LTFGRVDDFHFDTSRRQSKLDVLFLAIIPI